MSASRQIKRVYEVQCHARKKSKRCARLSIAGGAASFDITKRQAADFFRREGWRFLRGRWCCPACSKTESSRKNTSVA